MKRKQLILNFSLAIAVLFSILFQSIDSIGHLQEKFSEKKCHHAYNSSEEFTHQHHSFDHCYVCQFGFSSFTTPIKYSYVFNAGNYNIPYFFAAAESIFSFSGSLYSHRGPPNCI
ncbi:hypothetical protein CLU83_3791 [Flavobacterium sp. 1]|uniref:hypothetical protein n=1 Tax=Flavobacterium sp. 1 TaxID=2035200 RepID=UPI000C239D8E|nr:hypothetical protein [Flavobacterium sp. 1]PJJ10382.1 hypothetical protein CLU83_3791 [Flavobacterium sp. 1]